MFYWIQAKGSKNVGLTLVLLFQALSLNLNSVTTVSCNPLLSLSLCFSHRFPTGGNWTPKVLSFAHLPSPKKCSHVHIRSQMNVLHCFTRFVIFKLNLYYFFWLVLYDCLFQGPVLQSCWACLWIHYPQLPIPCQLLLYLKTIVATALNEHEFSRAGKGQKCTERLM